jgi:hypothetical protein
VPDIASIFSGSKKREHGQPIETPANLTRRTMRDQATRCSDPPIYKALAGTLSANGPVPNDSTVPWPSGAAEVGMQRSALSEHIRSGAGTRYRLSCGPLWPDMHPDSAWR